MKKFVTCALLALTSLMSVNAQRVTDQLDRGLVAVPVTGGNFVSWKVFAEEYYDVTYNLYCNGSKIASNLKTSNYTHTNGNSSSSYQVVPVVKGVERTDLMSQATKRWNNQYYQFPVAKVYDRAGNDVTSGYIINDVSLGDVDGDGVVEFLVKRNNHLGNQGDVTNKLTFHHYECYKLDGTLLWWMDLGPNMLAGPDEQWDAVLYDWDMDGKAEVLMRGADNMIIHQADGTVLTIGDKPNYDARTVYNTQYTCVGNEYLLYLEGATGKPYPIGDDGKLWMTYPLKRFEANEFSGVEGSSTYEEAYVNTWGGSNGRHDGGHRSMKHYFGAPFLDGRKASIFLGRGCYTRHKMATYDVDPATHKLTQRWFWSEYNGSSPWFGNGYHNFSIADVDEDGRDEIVFGSMVIDDNGKGLSTTGLGHGDAEIVGDLDPYRKGLEFFGCNEDNPSMNYRNATTSQIYYRLQSTSDDGRSLCGNFSNDYPGCQGRSTQSGLVSTVADKLLPVTIPSDAETAKNWAMAWFHLNSRIYWDGDLCDEVLDSPGTEKEAAVYKHEHSRLFTSSGCKMNNDSKNNACASADIFGDWREEIVVRTSDNVYIRIYTTNTPTTYRIPTLWHDHQYRNAMVWQCVGYNQPPQKSYFLGELEGLTVAPPPFTMTDRVEIGNGGTISTANANEHVMVCETNDTKISVTDGANPYIATFNVPSWVQGTNSNNKTNPVIKYDYYTCEVSGGAFAGNMRLVKQGDGVLTLPAVEQKYTGNTDIWAGTVNFDGKLLNSALWLNRFAKLNSNGGEFRSIKMDYAAELRPGGENQTGTVTMDTLTLGFGSRLVLDIFEDGTADKVVAKAVNIETKDWAYGPEFLTPVVEVVPHLSTGVEKIPEGEYLLAEFGNVTGEVEKLVLKGTILTQKSVLELREGKLYLVVSGVRDNSDIVWLGDKSSVWNASITDNFAFPDEELTATMFVNGDNVYFNDDAESFKVEINGEVQPDTMFVDNVSAYQFMGTGSIIGGQLVKTGAGRLTLSTDNTYKGGNHLKGGTTVVSTLSNANQAYGNLGGVTMSPSLFTIEDGAVLQTTAEVTNGSAIRLVGTEGGVINAGANFTQNSAFSGTQLTKRGNGTLRLATGNAALTKMIVAQGTVTMITDNSLSPAKTLEFQGGSFSDYNGNGSYSNYTYAVNVPEGKTGTWNLDSRATYKNVLTGAGTLTVNVQTTIQRTQLQGNWSAFEGTIKATTNSDAIFPLDNSYGLPKATLDLSSGITVGNSAKTFKIGKVTGSGNLGGASAYGSSVSGANTWQVGNDENFVWGGAVTGTGTNFTKLGSGKMTASGAWTTTGAVRVNEGEVHINSNTCLGTGSLTVAADASLTGVTGSIFSSQGNLTNSSYSINGTLQVGVGSSSTSGFMGFGGKNVTMGTNSVLRLGVSKCANETSYGGAALTNIGTMTMNGTVSVFLSSTHSLVAGDSVILWVADKYLGTPKLESYIVDEAAGLYWDDSQLARGVLYVTTQIPSGIHGVLYANDEDAPIYTIGGVKVAEAGADLKALAPGVYFRNGKKFVVK